ncbi:TerD family protein [Streptomyces venezuelae]|uniref:TerD family protein n=1 Tax=Streptomyces venezuelae TaxID=54571 RepID=UPI00278C4BA1|nr:TerD family protein [Streptomyces venezuelae]
MLRGLVKGNNAFVPTAALRVAVGGGVDVAALLVTERGRVRGDADIVFPGAPVHPSGAVRLSADADTVWLDADLTAVEEAITRVLVVTSTDDGSLRDAPGLSVRVVGPDGSAVVAYEVTDAGDETAMVLAELYRRAGGWKFRAVGQGYADGLTGLAADHGVETGQEPEDTRPEPEDVHREAEDASPEPEGIHPGLGAPLPEPEDTPPPPAAPQALPHASKVAGPPAQAPAPVPAAQSPAKVPDTRPGPAPAPGPGPGPWSVDLPFDLPVPEHWPYAGNVFAPRLLEGSGSDVLDAEGLPPGPVMVDLAVRTDGHTAVWTLTAANKEEDLLVNSTKKDWRGRLLAVVPPQGRLRLKLTAAGPWHARVLPLAAARRLTEDTLEAWGPEVLLHTGEATDVAFHYRGDSNFIVDSYDLAGHEDPARLPKDRYPYINEIGRRREALPVPGGTVLVHVQRADGPWRVRLKQPSAAVAWLRRVRD